MLNTRFNNDLTNLLILSIPVVVLSYVTLRLFGFPFILQRGAYLIGAVLLVYFLRKNTGGQRLSCWRRSLFRGY